MAVRLTCTDNASGHDGLRWRMGPDSESVDIVIGETAPGVGELVVAEPITPEACFSVVAYAGSEESDAAAVCATTDPDAIEWSVVSIGDEIGGGIYAGIHTVGETDYHIIASMQAGEVPSARWKTSQTASSDSASNDDGLSNTMGMINDGISSHPAAEHCVNYRGGEKEDWYLPAINELVLLYNNLRDHPEFENNRSSSQSTWSSTESIVTRAFAERFSSSLLRDVTKTSSLFVRPVRRVPV